MDRTTSKTNEIYVEFMTARDAHSAVRRFDDQLTEGRIPRIGKRAIEVEMSSYADMMKQLFPSARNMNWRTGIATKNSKYSWDNFQSFVTREEMTMLVKYADNPQRVSVSFIYFAPLSIWLFSLANAIFEQNSFSSNCKERPYDCMISTIKKMPWDKCKLITIGERDLVYQAAVSMVQVLVDKIKREPDHKRLTPQLLDRFVGAAMRCPGFTICQKDNISFQANWPEDKIRRFGLPRLACQWQHMYGITVDPRVPLDVVEVCQVSIPMPIYCLCANHKIVLC